jgi:hypothetical protein
MRYYRTLRILTLLAVKLTLSGTTANSDAHDNQQEVVIGIDGKIDSLPEEIEYSESHAEPQVDVTVETTTKDEIEETITTDISQSTDNSDTSTIVEAEDAIGESPSDPKCPSRSHVLKCAAKYLDLDQDRKLSRNELDTAIKTLPW